MQWNGTAEFARVGRGWHSRFSGHSTSASQFHQQSPALPGRGQTCGAGSEQRQDPARRTRRLQGRSGRQAAPGGQQWPRQARSCFCLWRRRREGPLRWGKAAAAQPAGPPIRKRAHLGHHLLQLTLGHRHGARLRPRRQRVSATGPPQAARQSPPPRPRQAGSRRSVLPLPSRHFRERRSAAGAVRGVA